MHFDRMKRFLLLTIAMLLAFNVFAASYVITDYEILVDGKTQKRVIRNLIIPEDTEEVFASEEELVAALDGKRQALVNKRVFKSVSYEYTLSEEEEGKIGAAVTYNIVDAKTFLAVLCGADFAAYFLQFLFLFGYPPAEAGVDTVVR